MVLNSGTANIVVIITPDIQIMVIVPFW